MSLSLYDLKQEINTINSDYTRSPGYAVANGSINTYIATFTPTSVVYVDGMCVSSKNYRW
jgi:hypothetical protein